MQEDIISQGQYIQGAWVKSAGPLLESINPANGKRLWHGTSATDADIAKAYQGAREALPSWSSAVEKRLDLVTTFSKTVAKNADSLSLLIAKETGKPLWEARTETKALIDKVDISIRAYQERSAQKEKSQSGINQRLRFKPQGVVLVLGAFNFPAHISNGHIIPALLAGNTILYKPSEQTPAVAELVMQCWHDSGLPAGVMHCLQGDGSCGAKLLSQDIQGVYFTGSYATGLAIHQQLASRPEVIAALEMGGNNPLIVDEVADIPAAVYCCLLSTLLTAGQRCTSARRLFIPKTAFGDRFLEQLLKAYKQVVIGPFDRQPEPFMGPVISYAQAEKLLLSQQTLIQAKGKPLLSLELMQANTGLLSPGIIDMTAVANACDEEFFGPLLQLYRYDNFEEAVSLANRTRFGLAAGLLSDKAEHYEYFYKTIRAGLINWNRPTTGAHSALPFGGVGISGNHRPSAYFAADYCSYPIASLEQPILSLPTETLPGIAVI